MQIAPTFLRSRQEQIVEARLGREIPDLLDDLYHRRGLTQEAIASQLGVSRMTVQRWMTKYAIPTGYNRNAA